MVAETDALKVGENCRRIAGEGVCDQLGRTGVADGAVTEQRVHSGLGGQDGDPQVLRPHGRPHGDEGSGAQGQQRDVPGSGRCTDLHGVRYDVQAVEGETHPVRGAQHLRVRPGDNVPGASPARPQPDPRCGERRPGEVVEPCLVRRTEDGRRFEPGMRQLGRKIDGDRIGSAVRGDEEATLDDVPGRQQDAHRICSLGQLQLPRDTHTCDLGTHLLVQGVDDLHMDGGAVEQTVTSDEGDPHVPAHWATCMSIWECGGQTLCGRVVEVLSQCALTV